MILSIIAVFLMWQTFRFRFTARGAVLSILYVIVVSAWSTHTIGVATATALIAGATTIIISYSIMVYAKVLIIMKKITASLSGSFSKMKR